MNTTLKFMRLAMAALMVATAAACSDDDENVLPPEDPNPDPVLIPVTFKVTVDDFVEVPATDVEMGL